MSYDAAALRVPDPAYAAFERVASFITSLAAQPGRPNFRSDVVVARPVLLGAYLTHALLGKHLPDKMDVLIDLDAACATPPRGWSAIQDFEPPLLMRVGEHVVDTLGTYRVDGVRPWVRLLRSYKPIGLNTLVMLPDLGVLQVVYDGDAKRRTCHTNLFAANLRHMLVSVTREDALTPAKRKAARMRAKDMAERLGFKGVGVIPLKAPA